MFLHEISMKIVQLLWEFHMRFMQATFACVGFSKQLTYQIETKK